MGTYTSLRCEVVLKEEFVPVIRRLMDLHNWEEVAQLFPEYAFLKTWCEKWRCNFIPFGAMSYDRGWSEDTSWELQLSGKYWKFQCSLKDYTEEIKTFVENVLPFLAETAHQVYSLCEEDVEVKDWTNTVRKRINETK